MKRFLSVSLVISIIFSNIFFATAASDTTNTESDIVVKTSSRFYTVMDSIKATNFGISPNAKGTAYYVDPKQSDNEVVFGSATGASTGTSYAVESETVADNPNFTVAKKFTITDIDAFNSATFNSVNIYQDQPTALQEWINTPYADMRFWIKTGCDFTATLSLMNNNGDGSYPHITHTLSVSASDDWQEIRIKRDEFSDSNSFKERVNAGQGKVVFRLMAADDMLPEGETVQISQLKFNNGTLDIDDLQKKYVDYSYYYNNFQSYCNLRVVDSSYYDGTYNYNNEFRVATPSITDISGVVNTGSVRFWISVPKDMKIRFGFSSYVSGDNGRVFCTKELKVSDNDPEGFQEVVIPLSDFTENRETKFSWQHINFFAIKGISSCTAETFLDLDETLKVSPIEIWSGAAAEAKPAYTHIPKYYSINGKVTVVDLNCTMDTRTQINAFAVNTFSDEYIGIAEILQGDTTLIGVYSINAVLAGAVASESSMGEYEQYAVTQVDADMNVLIQVPEDVARAAQNKSLKVGVVNADGFSEKTYDITDEYLIVNTNELGDFLFVKEDVPILTLTATGLEDVYDNTIITSGKKIARNGSGYKNILSKSSDVNTVFETVKGWLANENGQLSFWVKAPWQEGEPVITRQIDLMVVGKIGGDAAYPHQHAPFEVKADGYWHEVRVNAADFIVDTAGKDDFSTTTDVSSLYVRVSGTNGVNDIYWFAPDFVFYNETITSETPEGEGNILLTEVETGMYLSGGWSHVNVNKATVKVYDNKFTQDAVKFTVSNVSDYAFKNTYPSLNDKKDTITGEEFKDFLANRGDMRTYVKNTSGHDMTFRVGIKINCGSASSSSYAEWMKEVTVSGDSKWHEVRISYSDLNFNTNSNTYKALAGTDGYTYTGIYFNVSGLNDDFTATTDELYFTKLQVYNRALIGTSTDEINDANIKLEQSAVIGEKDGGGVTGVTVEEVKISDNKFCRTAMKYYNPVIGSYKFTGNAYPYKISTLTGNEFVDFMKNHGDMRTYIKNVSDHDMTFTIGIKIHYTGDTSGYSAPGKSVTIPGDGKWHEVRISYDELGVTNSSGGNYKAMSAIDGYKIDLIRYNIGALDDDFKASTDELYFTPLEIYNRSIEEAETTDFAREYVQSGLMTSYYSTKKDDKTLTHSNTTYVGEYLPFFTKAVTYTKVADSTATPGAQSGFVSAAINNGVKSEAFKDWYYNDNAELRFWVKSEKDTEFRFGLYVDGNGARGETQTGVISITGSPDWQEVIVKRSQFASRNASVESVISGDSFSAILFFRATGNTMANTNQFHLSQAVEFYSDKAYAKGDVNCDNNVDIIDLIRLKKQAAATGVNNANCDINNTGTIDSNDLTLIRKRLLVGKWS